MKNTNSLSTRLDNDQLNSISRDLIAHRAHALLEPIQNQKGEEILAASAVIFAVMVERFSGNPEALFQYGNRLLHGEQDFHKKTNDSLESLRDFAALRIHQKPVI